MDTLKLKTVGLFHSDDLEFLQDLVSIVAWQWEEERVVSCPCQGQSRTVDTVTHVHRWLVVAAGRELGLRKNAPVRRKLRSCGQRGRRCNASAKSFLPVDFDVFGRYQDPMDPTHLMHLMHLMAKLIIRLCFMVSSA